MATFFGGVAASMYAALSVLHQNEAAKGGYVKIDADRINRLPSRPLEWGWAGLTATPYLFDAALAGAVLSSTPPDQEVLCDLRLPHRRTLVLFGAPYELGTDSGWWTDEDLARAEAGDALKVEVRDALGLPDTGDLFDIGRDSFASLLYRHGGKVHGMLLFSDEHGFVRDQVVWLVETADDHPGGGMNQTIPGRISRSTLEPLVHNVAAAAWGKWQAPDPAQVAKMPTNLDELNKVKNTGNFRRRAQREEAYGVHVIDQRPQSSPAGGATSSGAVVTPHVRRGHWRSVRVAARDAAGRIVGGVHGEHGADWRYEGRWVQPTFVNSHLGQGPRGKVPVYRIPSRDEFTSVAA